MKNFLTANWENIIMANYAVDPKILQPYLPKGVTLDLYKGVAYISLVGFMFKNTKIFKVPIPLLGSFEEINLRFYVIRNVNGIQKRGVVFINETVPYKLVALIANFLYKENYSCVPTKHLWQVNNHKKSITYQWKKSGKWNKILVEATVESIKLEENSFEEFILEHYIGYTKINNTKSEQYTIAHPRWKINVVKNYEINCNFEAMYGSSFLILNNTEPHSVFIADGSAVSIQWKRERF